MSEKRLLTFSLNFVALIGLLLSLWILVKPLSFSFWPDFNVYYHSAMVALHGQNPYSLKGIFVGGYLYPPVSLLIFFPLLLFSVVLAGKIWVGISIVCLISSIYTLLKLFHSEKKFMVVCITGILVCNYFPVKFTLGMGQLNMLTLLFATVALYAISKNKSFLAGTIWGTAITIKYFPLLIPAYFLVKKKWRIFFAMLASIIVLMALGVIVFKVAITRYFFENIFFHLTSSVKIDYYNQALSGFLLRDFKQISLTEVNIFRFVIFFAMLFLTGWVVLKKKTKKLQLLEIGIFINLSLLLNTFSWQHQFTLLIIPLIITWFTLQKYKLKWQYPMLLGISYLLTAINAKTPAALPVIFQSHVFYGAFLLWVLDLYLLNNLPKHEK